MKFDIKQDKGVAGLTILLSLITMLFVIGLLVMIFSLMGGEIMESDTVKKSGSASATQNLVNVSASTVLTTCDASPNGDISGVTSIVNASGGGAVTDYATSLCTLSNTTVDWAEDFVNITYTYTFSGESYEAMNGTIQGISNTTDWFDIFIVIGSMVVLILLTVIIITAIRGSGLMGVGGETKSGGTVGSA